MSSPSERSRQHIDQSTELIQELEALADFNERRSLWICGGVGLSVALLLPLVAVLLETDFNGRSGVFWFGASIIEVLVVFAVWYCAVIVIAPPRSNLEKMIEAITHAVSDPVSVSLSQSGRQVTIHLPQQRVILTGPEAKLFLKHWRKD